jgi:hypothetical protein
MLAPHHRGALSVRIVCFAVLVATTVALARSAELDYRVSWLGNSFSGAGGKWVQNFFIHMNTKPDGSCVTWSHWDEGGKRFGIYKNGDVIANEDEHANSLKVKDRVRRTWTLAVTYVTPDDHEYDFHPAGIRCEGKPVSFPDLFEPTALGLANDGTLMVADSGTGPRQQVLFFDISDPDHPRLTRAFGDYGGIASGTPGAVTPTKFWGIRGVGMDAEGNLFVAQSEMGSVLRKFTTEGKLAWELFGHAFVDLMCADPKTDGLDVWGIQEHYEMDYSRPPGKEARWVGYSLDRHKYPDDPRGLTYVKQQGEHGLTSPQIVYLEGKRFQFTGGMFASNFINIFRYEGEMAVPSGVIMQWDGGLYRTSLTWPPNRPKGPFLWRDKNGDGHFQADEYEANTDRIKPGPFHVDEKGNIWMAYGFFRYDFQGLDPKANPIYSADKITPLEKPNGMKNVARVWYRSETDTLVAAEEGVEEGDRPDMRHIGRVFVCKGYLSGNRNAVIFRSGAGREAACVAVAGDYVFTGGWKARGRVWINRLSDGAAVSVLDPGPTLGGVENTGWIDIFTGISAHKRKNGEYLVFVEEDYKAKVILYRWRP